MKAKRCFFACRADRSGPPICRLGPAATAALALAFFPGAAATYAEPSPAQWNNEFARDMFGKMGEEHPGENFAFSPFSIVTAFGMAYAGARGNTAAQLEEVFRFDGGAEAHPALAAWADLVKEAATAEETVLEPANRVWLERGWPAEETFLEILSEYYDAPAEPADFTTQPGMERERINEWVYERTRKRIEDLLPEEAIDSLTRFVLVNALYFRGLWEFPFSENSTTDAPFYLRDGEETTVSMMARDHMPVRHAATDLATAIALSVEDDSFSFVVVLPEEDRTVAEVLSAIAAGELDLEVSEWDSGSWRVELPRFQIEAETSLDEVLYDMGVTDAFDPDTADFTGIYTGPEPELHLTSAHHKAFVEINETGLEATAATSAVGGVTSVPPLFRVDRPFLFFLTEDTTGTILFAGQVVRPVENALELSSNTRGYEDWREEHFTEEERANPGISDPDATPSGDGVENLLKYAFGIGPDEPARGELPVIARPENANDDMLVMEVTRAADAGVEWILQASADLSDWYDVDFSVEPVETLPGNRERVRLVGAVPGESGRALFYRLRVALAGE